MDLRCRTAALLVGIAIQVVLPIAVGATPLVSASVDGSTDNLSMTFRNEGLTSADDIVSIVIFGGTGDAFPILWDYAGFPTDPAGADCQIVGENTHVLTITFADDPDGFNAGETFTLENMDPDGDPKPSSVTLDQLSGVEVNIRSRDESTFHGFFAQEEPGGLLVLVPIPEPASGALLLLGLAGIALARRRRS